MQSTATLLEPSATDRTCLCDLAVGSSGYFQTSGLEDEINCFLAALGLTRRSKLRLCKAGDPCIVQVRSTRIALSRSVARQIYVTPIVNGRA